MSSHPRNMFYVKVSVTNTEFCLKLAANFLMFSCNTGDMMYNENLNIITVKEQ